MSTKLVTAVSVVVIACLAIPATAAAKDRENYSDKSGRFGIGYDSTLGGVGGLSARFQVAKNFGIQGVVGYGRSAIDLKTPGTNQTSTSTVDQQFRFALRGDVGFAFTRQAVLSILFGANIYYDSNDVTVQGSASNTSDTRFSFEAGLKAEYHFTDFFSVHGEVGFLFALVNRASDVALITSEANGGLAGSGGAPADDVDGSLILFGLGEPFGSFGFTFWFK